MWDENGTIVLFFLAIPEQQFSMQWIQQVVFFKYYRMPLISSEVISENRYLSFLEHASLLSLTIDLPNVHAWSQFFTERFINFCIFIMFYTIFFTVFLCKRAYNIYNLLRKNRVHKLLLPVCSNHAQHLTLWRVKRKYKKLIELAFITLLVFFWRLYVSWYQRRRESRRSRLTSSHLSLAASVFSMFPPFAINRHWRLQNSKSSRHRSRLCLIDVCNSTKRSIYLLLHN